MTLRTTCTEDALRSAADWRLLGLLLERPRPGWSEEIAALAAETHDPALRDAAAGIPEATEGEYLALIGPGGLASPREAGYVGMQDPACVLSDVVRFYRAFAFAPGSEDPPDHVAIEVAFVAYLYLKEAFALEARDTDAAETTRRARETFVAEHVAAVARPLADRLAPAAATPTARAVGLLAARVPPPPARPETPDADVPSGCDTCAL